MIALRPTADTAPLLTEVRRTGPGAAEAIVAWPSTLPVFAGHFPGAPIVPGVYLLAATLALAAHVEGRSLRLTRCARVRFQQPVRPEERVTVSVLVGARTPQAVTIDARLTRDGASILQARIDAHADPAHQSQ